MIALLTPACNRSPGAEDIRSEVLFEFRQLTEAVQSQDTEAYYAFFDQDHFTAQFGGMTIDSFAAFKAIYDSILPDLDGYLSLEFPVVEVRVINETSAVLINEYSEVVLTVSGDTVRTSGSGTQVWDKTSGHWKLVHVAGSTK
ncbi:YybH family protein [Balneola sp. MJW-20]|uniref:YybH family protein n=1 Tax=Gracilimonas aurantiaca TaxID=3234185 RepID=UPI00390C6347